MWNQGFVSQHDMPHRQRCRVCANDISSVSTTCIFNGNPTATTNSNHRNSRQSRCDSRSCTTNCSMSKDSRKWNSRSGRRSCTRQMCANTCSMNTALLHQFPKSVWSHWSKAINTSCWDTCWDCPQRSTVVEVYQINIAMWHLFLINVKIRCGYHPTWSLSVSQKEPGVPSERHLSIIQQSYAAHLHLTVLSTATSYQWLLDHVSPWKTKETPHAIPMDDVTSQVEDRSQSKIPASQKWRKPECKGLPPTSQATQIAVEPRMPVSHTDRSKFGAREESPFEARPSSSPTNQIVPLAPPRAKDPWAALKPLDTWDQW